MASKITPQVYTRQQEKERRRFKRGVKRLLDALTWPITRVEKMFQFVSSDDWGPDYSFLSAFVLIFWFLWLSATILAVCSVFSGVVVVSGLPLWIASMCVAVAAYLAGIIFAHEASQFDSRYE